MKASALRNPAAACGIKNGSYADMLADLFLQGIAQRALGKIAMFTWIFGKFYVLSDNPGKSAKKYWHSFCMLAFRWM